MASENDVSTCSITKVRKTCFALVTAFDPALILTRYATLVTGDCLIWMIGESTQQAETMKGRRAHVPASFGTMYNFSATVQLHEEYQGMKQTKTSRARVKVSWQSHPLVVVLKVSYCGQFSQ